MRLTSRISRPALGVEAIPAVQDIGWVGHQLRAAAGTEVARQLNIGGEARQGNHVRVDMLFVALPKRLAIRLEQLVDLVGLGISLVLLYYGSAVVSDAWRTNMVAYKTWYVPEWLLFLAIPTSALLLAIEFVLRLLRVQGVVRDTYDITDRASL